MFQSTQLAGWLADQQSQCYHARLDVVCINCVAPAFCQEPYVAELLYFTYLLFTYVHTYIYIYIYTCIAYNGYRHSHMHYIHTYVHITCSPCARVIVALERGSGRDLVALRRQCTTDTAITAAAP